jgi:two-component system OmpR family response regulator
MRVLVIEDDPDLLDTIACNLREEGHAVSTAEDGEYGLFKATSWDYNGVEIELTAAEYALVELLSGTHPG